MKKFLIFIFIIAINSNDIHATLTLIDKQDLVEAKEDLKNVRQSILSELKEANNTSTQAKIASEWEKLYQKIKQGHALPVGAAIITGVITGGISGETRNQLNKNSILWIPLWLVERIMRGAIINDLVNNMQRAKTLEKSMHRCGWLASWITYLIMTKGQL